MEFHYGVTRCHSARLPHRWHIETAEERNSAGAALPQVQREDEKQAMMAGLQQKALTSEGVEKHLVDFGLEVEAASHTTIQSARSAAWELIRRSWRTSSLGRRQYRSRLLIGPIIECVMGVESLHVSKKRASCRGPFLVARRSRPCSRRACGPRHTGVRFS